jgi:hypothetical protein
MQDIIPFVIVARGSAAVIQDSLLGPVYEFGKKSP